MIKIGFLDRSDASWTAGASYSRSMVNALASAADGQCEICVVSGSQSSISKLPPNVRPIRADVPGLTPALVFQMVRESGLDVLLPVTEVLLPDTPCALVGWIPDFQHRRLEQYFTGDQRAQRNRHFKYLVDNCDAMVFSSEAVRSDFRELYPDFAGPSASVHFCSSFAYEEDLLAGDPRAVLEKYRLPRAFVLVANQFWKHKNHRLVVEAVAQARRTTPGVHVVMVGMLSDSRDTANPHITDLVQRLTIERLFENISVLGEVPFRDLVALMRCATEIVQPSEFEGWNTTVQDALALGKALACSDIPTHREQAPGAFFFPPDDASVLATHLAALDWSGDGWTGEAEEQESLRKERERGRQWAADMIKLCESAVACFGNAGRARTAWVDPIEELRANPLTYIDYLEAQVAGLRENNDWQCAKVEKLQQRIQTDRVKAAANEHDLREKLKAAKAETQDVQAKYSREKMKPLRTRLRDEVARLWSRSRR